MKATIYMFCVWFSTQSGIITLHACVTETARATFGICKHLDLAPLHLFMTRNDHLRNALAICNNERFT